MYENEALRDQAINAELSNHNVGLALLLGDMRKLGPVTLGAFRNRILNIHPALLPEHGGKGRYGIYVHESVLASGDTETGVSIHVVSQEYDQGPIQQASPTKQPLKKTTSSMMLWNAA